MGQESGAAFLRPILQIYVGRAEEAGLEPAIGDLTGLCLTNLATPQQLP